jgi:hypothetical protein
MKLLTLLISCSFAVSALADIPVPFSFEGTLGGKYEVVASLARSNGTVEGYYFYKGRKSGLSLKGTVDSAGKLALDESDGRKKTGAWTGQWTKDQLQGEWSDPGGKKLPFSLKPIKRAAADWLRMLGTNYEGSIGIRYAISFQAQSATDAEHLAGIYRYQAKTGSLAWTGAFRGDLGDVELVEKDAKGNVTGQWRGKVLPGHLDGVWTNPKTKKQLVFSLHAVAFDPFHSMPLRSRFQVSVQKAAGKAKHCESSSEFAQIDGLPNPVVQAKINSELKSGGTAQSCDAPDGTGSGEDGESETISEFQASSCIDSIVGDRYLSALVSSWEVTGGAHGNGGSSCKVFVLTTGEVVSLSKFLKPGAIKLLSERIIQDVYDGNREDAAFFVRDDFEVSDGEICIRNGGLSFHFDAYVVASYAAGPQEIVVDGDGWKKYFEVNDVTKKLF